MNEKQQLAMREAKSGRSFFLSGAAGTGKSYALQNVIHTTGGEMTATTGIAAHNVGGSTLHAWAGVGLADRSADHYCHNMKPRTKSRIALAKTLAIDEISMAPASLIDLVSEVCSRVRGDSRPFGGIQIVFCGDFLQLAPVSKTSTPKFAFEALAWSRLGPKTIELDEIVRQQDAKFCKILNAIRTGESRDLTALRGRMVPVPENVSVTRLRTHNRDVCRENAHNLATLDGEAVEFAALDSGDKHALKHCALPEFLRLKLGAQVVSLSNAPFLAGRVHNGQLGKVVGFTRSDGGRGKVAPIVDFGDGRGEVLPIVREAFAGAGPMRRLVATREQLPLALGWAITIHKSQGMTLERVEVDLTRSFAPGQAYTALSRCRDIGGLYLSGASNVKVSNKALAFYHGQK